MAGNRGELRQGWGDIHRTRRKRPNYFILNDGSDEEAPLEDRIEETTMQSEANPSIDTPATSEIQTEIQPEIRPEIQPEPSESISQSNITNN
jgi:hypothetical protein